jgi:uncharacterized membrane protein
MRFLLINTNPAVSKLVNASLERIGHEVTEISNYNSLSLDTYVLVIVDSDSYKPEYKDDLLSVSLAPSLMYLKAQNDTVPQGISYVLKKPFLPTDFIALLVSILQQTPELKRFITPEAEQFKTSVLKDYTVPQVEKVAQTTPLVEPDILDDTTNKNPIFDIQESQEQTDPFNKVDIFANLSEELSRIYSGEDESVEELSAPAHVIETNAVQTEQKHEPSAPIQENIQPAYESVNLDEFMFELKNANEGKIVEPQVIEPQVIEPKIIEPKVVEPKVVEPEPEIQNEEPQKNENIAQELNKPTSIDEITEKVNFDFDIFDKIEEQAQSAKSETKNDVDEPDLTPPKSIFEGKDTIADDMPLKEKVNFGFGDLAKEFDDLLQTDKNDESVQKDDNFIKADNAQKPNDKKTNIFNEEIGGLSEKDMETALQNGGMLPQPSEIEVVKTEIEHMVEQSVKGVLQSQILREVLKGLKMNITITFEDK